MTGPARQRTILRILHCRNFLRFVGILTLLVMSAALSQLARAQEDRPEIVPGERRTPRKKDAGPRAVGLIQLGANGKASIIPLAILINGKFWDASVYKADPVPMALDSGVVYEGERSGNSLGLFTIGSALHSNNPNAAIPWLGTGVWRPTGTEPTVKVAKAESSPVGIGSDDGPPRLTRDTSTAKPSTAPASGSTPSSSSAPSSSSGSASAPSSSSGSPSSNSKPASSSGDEPPRLTKGSSTPSSEGSGSQPPAGSATNPADSKSGDSKAGDSKPGDSKSTDAKSSASKASAGPNVPASDSGATEANRPILRRGKPAESFADEDIPGYSLPGVKPAKGTSGKVVEAAAANKDVQLIPAISDAAGPEPKSFAFEWIPGEEADRRKQMVDLAKDQVRAYVAARSARSKAEAAAPPHAGSKRHTAAPKLPDPILENMQMVAYDVWGSNQPVLILSAQAHMPPSAGSSESSQTSSDMTYWVVLVAYPDIYHNLHKLYSGITDKFHLDMTPRLELIDAVDADGDGRGELLFRETSDIGTGWAIYRVTADKLWRMFDSLNPE